MDGEEFKKIIEDLHKGMREKAFENGIKVEDYCLDQDYLDFLKTLYSKN